MLLPEEREAVIRYAKDHKITTSDLVRRETLRPVREAGYLPETE